MKIAFTICSNNYLAQVNIMLSSFKRYHSNYYTIIVLVDELSELVDYEKIGADEIIPIILLSQYGLVELFDMYNIIELNTAVKPFVFKYFLNKFKNVEIIYYFDPDLKFFGSLENLTEQLQSSSIVLTPHILEPIQQDMDGLKPQESLFLNHGIYNLGFLGLNAKHENIPKFLDWWGERTFHQGYDDTANGLFVDQLWMNFTPLFFKDVIVSLDRGLNMGPWNLHERSVKSVKDQEVLLSNGDALKFYHFSSYSYKKPNLLSKHYNRYSFENVGLLKELYNEYNDELLLNGVEKISTIPYAHGKTMLPVNEKNISFGFRLKRKIANIFQIVVGVKTQ